MQHIGVGQCEHSLKQVFVWNDLQKGVHVILPMLGAIFAQIFRNFAEILTDFTQILPGFST